MKSQIQVALVLAAVLYGLWAVGLLVAPDRVHPLLSAGPFNAALASLFGAALFAFAALFLFAANDPTRSMVYASAAVALLMGATAGYQMFVVHSMPHVPATVVTLALNITLGLYLAMTLSEEVAQLSNGRARGRKMRMRSGRRGMVMARRA